MSNSSGVRRPGFEMMCSGTADIVQQRRRLQRIQFALTKTDFFADFSGVDANALQMIVRGGVLGFNGEGQRLDGSQVESRDLFDVRFILLQPVDVHPVGAIDEIDQREKHQRRVPGILTAQHHHQPCHRRGCQVIGQNPEVS